MNCELDYAEEEKGLTDSELALLMGIGSGTIKAREKRVNFCVICSMQTPNSGPFCTVCQLTYGQSRDGVTR